MNLECMKRSQDLLSNDSKNSQQWATNLIGVIIDLKSLIWTEQELIGFWLNQFREEYSKNYLLNQRLFVLIRDIRRQILRLTFDNLNSFHTILFLAIILRRVGPQSVSSKC